MDGLKISRKQAQALELVRYFTGEPCREGHISERYVKNGACMMCMGRDPNAPPRAPSVQRQAYLDLQRKKTEIREAELAIKNERQSERELAKAIAAARVPLTKFKTLCPHPDIGHLRTFTYLCASLREPLLRFQDVACAEITPGSPGGNVGLYTLKCFPEDRESIVGFAKDLMRPKQVSPAEIAALRQQRVDAALKAADAEQYWPTEDPK